jgi:enterochelin esterase-like enzyme
VPFVEETYPAVSAPAGRLLVGFSKSGWGAWSLLLRHLGMFSKAAAWDAPLMMDRPDKFGMRPIFGTQENFAEHQISRLLPKQAAQLQGEPRLLLLGYGNFRSHHQQAHALMDKLGVRHVYKDGPERPHDWASGWLPEAVAMLVK